MKLFRLSQNAWGNGLRLALLNGLLAAFSVVSFMGVLYTISFFNELVLASGNSSFELPFPYPVLLLLYAIMFPIAWIGFGRYLNGVWRERIITALVGSSPLFALSLLGYVSVIGAIIFDKINPDFISVASFFVFGAISTLILLAGMTSVGLVLLVRLTISKFNLS